MRHQTGEFDITIHKRLRLRYRLWLPAAYDVEQRWPLLLFLHGRGERGDDLALIERHGLPRKLAAGWELPVIVAAPQCPLPGDWTLHDDAILALLDALCSDLAVDRDRLYLTGLSMGGRATWRLAAVAPERWAAIVPICGRRPDGVRSAEDAQLLRSVPVWAFHGALDRVVPVDESRAMVAALESCGANPRLTVYPDLGHDAWTRAYDEPTLFPWLLRQRRRGG